MTAYVRIKQASIDFPVAVGARQLIGAGGQPTAVGGAISQIGRGMAQVRALDHIDLEIREGDRVGIMGNNGAGKSTLLRLICGIYPPTGGRVEISGRISSMLDLNLGFSNNASGMENIRIRGMLSGYSIPEIEKRTPQIAEMTELGDFLKVPMRAYSSGMRMRLAFAIATAFDPDILIMDEWLSTGDGSFRDKASARLQEFVQQSRILVMASHNDSILKDVCNRGIVMDSGKIVFDGDIREAIGRRRELRASETKRSPVGITIEGPCPHVVAAQERQWSADPEKADHERFVQRLRDLCKIQRALDAYCKDNKAYPKTDEKWFGVGRANLEQAYWIPQLVPKYLDFVPFDPLARSTSDCQQYLYGSNGVGYKLIAMTSGGKDMPFVRQSKLNSLIDPARPTYAYGTWTPSFADY